MLQYKNGMKKTWNVIKEIMGKMHQHNMSRLPRKLIIEKKFITSETEIAQKFNEFFTEIGRSLARKIPTPVCLTINKLKDAFFSLKMNKSTLRSRINGGF